MVYGRQINYYDFFLFLRMLYKQINQKQVEPLIHLVREVREQLIQARPGSLVIWYDSVTTSGKITYHDELVKENKPFFDVCDGIFLNYGW